MPFLPPPCRDMPYSAGGCPGLVTRRAVQFILWTHRWFQLTVCFLGGFYKSEGVYARGLSRVPLLSDPADCSPPGSSVRGMSQARILEWVAISFSRGSFQPRDQTWVSRFAGRFFTTELPGKPHGASKLNSPAELFFIF